MTSPNTLYKEIIIPPFLNPGSIGDLTKQITELENSTVRFLVLKGSDTVFCNGLDLKWVANNKQGSYMKEMEEYGEFLKKLQTGKFISIAVVTGSASGGGMGIVCACDHVITVESGTFSLPEGLLGLIPGMILPSLLNRLSVQQIKKMVLTGQKYLSDTACKWGIVDEVVKNEELQKAITQAISKMKSCKQEAVGDIKQLLYASSHLNKDEVAELGMNILSNKLNDPDIKQRLTDLAEFMED
jgi:enoyl-CoA hydratase/carnithine racemase